MSLPHHVPFARFAEVFSRARAAQPQDPNAVTLATVDAQGRPSARVVLLKDFDERGFVLYTNGQSRKGRELSQQAVAALCFYWPALQEQVRVEGRVEPVSAADADAYFATRPRESQVGAWASLQSQTLGARSELEARVADLTRRFEGQAVPRPPHWGGFRVVPTSLEFWKAHPFRLHWREVYERDGEGWALRTLYP